MSQSSAKEKKHFFVKDIVSGEFLASSSLSKQLPLILLITFLVFVYISNRYKAEGLVREISNLKTDVKELRYESISLASELMNLSNQSQVSRLVAKKQLGLQEIHQPPMKIEVGKDELLTIE